jgi:hypothetical protein
MHAGEQRNQHGQRDAAMEQPEQAVQPPRGPVEQGKRGGIAEGESLPQVDEESGGSG